MIYTIYWKYTHGLDLCLTRDPDLIHHEDQGDTVSLILGSSCEAFLLLLILLWLLLLLLSSKIHTPVIKYGMSVTKSLVRINIYDYLRRMLWSVCVAKSVCCFLWCTPKACVCVLCYANYASPKAKESV